MPNALEAFAELERRFNGPIPEMDQMIARHGSRRMVEILHAQAQAMFFREMATRQIKAIRMRRKDDSYYPSMTKDLMYYIAEWRKWKARAR